MEYFFWALGVGLLLLIVIKYREAKSKHQAAANAVFAKYTFDKLVEDDQNRVKEKAKEHCSSYSNELVEYAWYAVAMSELSIQSAIPDNPNWYKTKTPDVLVPSEVMVKAVITFINRTYDLGIELGGISSGRASKEIRDAVAELDHIDNKTDQKV